MQENQTTENTQDANNVPKKTESQIVESMKALYIEQNILDEDIKALKDEAKSVGYNAALLACVAKAMANSKTNDILEKNELFAKIVDKIEGN